MGWIGGDWTEMNPKAIFQSGGGRTRTTAMELWRQRGQVLSQMCPPQGPCQGQVGLQELWAFAKAPASPMSPRFFLWEQKPSSRNVGIAGRSQQGHKS